MRAILSLARDKSSSVWLSHTGNAKMSATPASRASVNALSLWERDGERALARRTTPSPYPLPKGEGNEFLHDWIAAPEALAISEREVHVWKVDLFQRAVPDVNGVLSSDERERASRFHFERDRQRF